MAFSSRRNETACAREHPRIATTQWDRISMAPFQVPLKTSQCTFFKSKWTGIETVDSFFPLFSTIRVSRYEINRLMNPKKNHYIWNHFELSYLCPLHEILIYMNPGINWNWNHWDRYSNDRLILERILIEDKALDSVLRFVGKLINPVYRDFQLPV